MCAIPNHDRPLCNRCLIQLSASSVILARGKRADGFHGTEPCEFITNPPALASWARQMLYDREWTISVNERDLMFMPIATWHGDPVCSTHLFFLNDAESRSQRR